MTNSLPSILGWARYSYRWKLFAGMILTVVADFLFFGETIGWTLAPFRFLLLLVLILHNPASLKYCTGKLLFVLLSGLVVQWIYHPHLLSIALFIPGMICMTLANHEVSKLKVWTWIQVLFKFDFFAWLRATNDIRISRKLYKRRPENLQWMYHLKPWLLPIGLTLIFSVLIGNANPIVLKWFLKIDLNWLFEFLSFERFLFWLLVWIVCWPIIRPRLKWRAKPIHNFEGPVPSWISFLFSKESILRSLICFNILFLIQTVLDIRYLWWGSQLPTGLTYAQYAHQGAYPLIATALLAGIFVMIALRPGSETETLPVIRRLVFLWIGQNILLVFSSIWRMHLYVEEYSLTYLRYAALIWMGLVAMGLGWIVCRIVWRKSNLWLANSNATTLLVVLYICSFSDTGRMIAQYNVEHCWEVSQEGQYLDIDYLESIGPASISALKRYRDHGKLAPYRKKKIRKLEARFSGTLSKNLADWHSWTLRDYQLRKTYIDETLKVHLQNQLGKGWAPKPLKDSP